MNTIGLHEQCQIKTSHKQERSSTGLYIRTTATLNVHNYIICNLKDHTVIIPIYANDVQILMTEFPDELSDLKFNFEVSFMNLKQEYNITDL